MKMLDNNAQLLSSEIFCSIVNRMTDGILLASQGKKLLYANAAAKSILQIPDSIADEQTRECLESLFVGLAQHATEKSDSPLVDREEVKLMLESGKHIWVETTATKLNVGGQEYMLLQLRDITALKDMESRLYEEATTDFLSGLANRRQFRRLLDEHAQEQLCMAVVDVDHFKNINDEFGHAVGDNAIRFVAEKLTDFFSNEICVARLGGEEFGVVLSVEDRDSAERLFELFRSAVETGTFCKGDVKITVSIGVAFSQENTDIYDLLVNADKALYESKNAGRNKLTIHGN